MVTLTAASCQPTTTTTYTNTSKRHEGAARCAPISLFSSFGGSAKQQTARQPANLLNPPPATTHSQPGNELESEIEARQAQNPQSLRGVHEQIVRMVEQMVQNYLASTRRVMQRFNNMFDRVTGGGQTQLRPRESTDTKAGPLGESVVGQLQELSKSFRDFSLQWSRTVGKQQSPLIDRIPPRGVELWRDFWDTVRKQIRRINNEFLQVTRDMGRLLTGRRPANPDGVVVVVRPRENGNDNDNDNAAVATTEHTLGSLLYSAMAAVSKEQAIEREFQEFYEKLTEQLKKEQEKMDAIGKASGQQQTDDNQANNLIEELDDEQTRLVLTQNPGLRQQINQDINVFSSIFDIIRTFLSRLRGSAEDIRNILERPGALRDNNPVTPGPAVKPTVDQLLKDTIDSQRNINSQARPAGRR
jgi:hypothetical protein